jgi:hypothetical protein
MGHWGSQPWANDGAADWLDQFVEKTRVVEQIEAGLNLPFDQIDEVRAAASLLLAVADVCSFDRDDRCRLATQAVDRLSNAIEAGLYTNPTTHQLVLVEISRLRALITGSGDPVANVIGDIATERFGLALYDVVDIGGRAGDVATKDIVGTGLLDDCGVLHLRLEDGREAGFELSCRCVPAKTTDPDVA